ncbi:hypothetical protein KC19_1G110600 [Ceratodon purpureus]|uniref:DUF3504 domain-containing protein n=1 Tax=Ceratodon purpureus TaxID=3225 RepID=A0A8T0J6Z9_CERPU|nr:hypothetical protein KC19_1G110600 [Ceratodon purpureus]
MGEVRVSSRVNKGKRGRVQIVRVTADEPTMVPTPVVCHSSPGPSPVSKQRGKGRRKSRASRNLDSSLPVVPILVDPVVDPVVEKVSLRDMPVASHIQRVLGFETPKESIENSSDDRFCGFDPELAFEADDSLSFDFLLDTSSVAPEPGCSLVPRTDSVQSVQFVETPEVSPSPSVAAASSDLAAASVDLAQASVDLVDLTQASVDLSPASVDVAVVPASGNLDSANNVTSATNVVASTKPKKRCQFLPLDPLIFEKVCNMDESKSLKNETWAQNRFNSWRESVGLDTSISIVNLPLEEFADLLTRFFLCLCKDNGERYPSGSIGNMYDSFHRIIGRHQAKEMKLEKKKEPLIRISEHHFFLQTNAAIVKAMELSRDAGVNKPRSKPKCLSFEDEAKILSHPSHQLTHPKGVTKRMLYYCMSKFVIRGGKEAYNLKYKDFIRGVNSAGAEYVQYVERLSKNNKMRLGRCQEEHFRPTVTCYTEDVVNTWRTYDEHLGPDQKDGALFLVAIPDSSSKIWYKNSRVGIHTISNWLGTMASEANIEGKITNKSGRRTAITRMSIANVPRNVMCEITGHKNPASLDRYDDTLDVSREAAMRSLDAPPVEGAVQQYSSLKAQVTKDYIEHQAVNLPATLKLPTLEPFHDLSVISYFASSPDSIPAAPSWSSDPIQSQVSPTNASTSQVPFPGFNDGIMNGVPESFNSGPTSMNSRPCTQGFNRNIAGDIHGHISMEEMCVGACRIHCPGRSSSHCQDTGKFVGATNCTGPSSSRCHDTGKFVGAKNPYGNQRKHGQVFKCVPPQYAKTSGQMLREANFSTGCTYGVDVRSENPVERGHVVTQEPDVSDVSGFSDPELNDIMRMFEKKQEALRRLAGRKDVEAAQVREGVAAGELGVAAGEFKESVAASTAVEGGPRRATSTMAESEDANQAVAVRQTHQLQPLSTAPFSHLTNVNMVFGSDAQMEAVLNKMFGANK